MGVAIFQGAMEIEGALPEYEMISILPYAP